MTTCVGAIAYLLEATFWPRAFLDTPRLIKDLNYPSLEKDVCQKAQGRTALAGEDGIPLNQMYTRSRHNDMTYFSRLKSKRRIFKLLLHIPTTEEPSTFTLALRSARAAYLLTYKSPLFLALLQSDSVTAKSPKLFCPDLMVASCFKSISKASSLVLVILASRQLLGLLLSLCLINRCAALILPSFGAGRSGRMVSELWCWAM